MGRAKKGRSAFEDHYRSVYGSRWSTLLSALEEPARQVARLNRRISVDFARQSLGDWPTREMLGQTVADLPMGEIRAPRSDPQTGLLDFYFMDPASIVAAAVLEARPGERVLDLCSAPGGKSLILADALSLQEVSESLLVCNELSPARRGRLRAVLEDYLLKPELEKIRITGHDGAKWCLYETEAYDRILIDAPCSGERHVLKNRDELEVWSPARSRNLAVRQYALLASAILVAKTGARLVYSTCSISPLENDGVIAKLLKKKSTRVRALSVDLAQLALPAEPTEHGWMILPDRAQGFGPIYLSVLEII